MFELLIQIPGPVFLIYFWSFSIIAILIGWLWTLKLDNSTQYQAPALDYLNLFEIAALRDGRKGIIHTALFSLWQHQRITMSGETRNAKISSISSKPPQNEFEQIIFNFIAQRTRSPKEFFENAALHRQLNKVIEPLNQKLEQWHLKKTPIQLKEAKKVFWVVLFLIWVIGGSKLLLGLSRGMPVEFLIILLIVMTLITIWILIPKRNTRLGQQYLKKLTQHYQQLKVQPFTPPGLIQLVAILGVDGLTQIDTCLPFREAFSGTNSDGNTMGGGCGGGCGGGGGGGCGGCGGGGGGGGT